MQTIRRLTLLAGTLLTLSTLPLRPTPAADPVPYPKGYRQWTHVKSMVLQEGHPLFEAFGGIHHIYANPQAFAAYQKGGPFPDGSVIVFDLLEAKTDNGALIEGARKVVGVMLKDRRRYASTGGWGFEAFKGDTQERVVQDMHQCFGCHMSAKDTDYVFSRYRP